MRTRVQCAASALCLLLPLWLLAISAAPPATPPAPASRPAGIPLRVYERTGLCIGRPAAPVLPEIFIWDGNRIAPAPTQIIAGGVIKVAGFSGKYPVPVAAGTSGPAARKMWGIYADCLLDVTQLDHEQTKVLPMWVVLLSKGDVAATLGVSIVRRKSLYVALDYTVFADDNRKTKEGGPFLTFVFPVEASAAGLTRNGEKVEIVKGEAGADNVVRLEAVKRTDRFEWEFGGAKGSIRPLLLGSEPDLVEYHVARPPPVAPPAGG